MVGMVSIVLCLVASVYCHKSLTDAGVIKVGVEFLKEKLGHRLEWEWNTDWAQQIADEFAYHTIPTTKTAVDVHELWGINVYEFRDAQPVPNSKKERTNVNRVSKLLEDAATELDAAAYPDPEDIIGVGVGVRFIENILSANTLHAYFVLLKRTDYFERFNYIQATFLHGETIGAAKSEVFELISTPKILRERKIFQADITGHDSKTLLSGGANNNWESWIVVVTGVAIGDIRQFAETRHLGISKLKDAEILVVKKYVYNTDGVVPEKVPGIEQNLLTGGRKVNEDGKLSAFPPISQKPVIVKPKIQPPTVDQEIPKGEILVG